MRRAAWDYSLARLSCGILIAAAVAVGVVRLLNHGPRHKNPQTAFDFSAAGLPIPPAFEVPGSNVSDLPPLAQNAPWSPQWDGIEGLRLLGTEAPRQDGEPVLLLQAARMSGHHQIGIRYSLDATKSAYRITAFFQPLTATHFSFDVSDLGAFHAVTYINIEHPQMTLPIGAVSAMGVQPLADGWMETWIEFKQNGGQITTDFSLLDSRGADVYNGDGKVEFRLGGMTVRPIN